MSTSRQLHVRNVYTQETIASLPLADERAIDDAIGAAHAAFSTTRAVPAYERAEVLRAAAAGIERRARELADTIVAEAGKPITLAEAEVARAVATFTLACEESRRFGGGEPIEIDAFAPAGRTSGWCGGFP